MVEPYPRWRLFPAWRQAGPWVEEIVDAFRSVRPAIDSATHRKSNEVLAGLRPALLDLGFIVEGPDRVPRPVLFGDEGQVVKSFNVDAYREDDGVALELEAGGAVYNNRILLDLMKMALAVDVTYGVIAVPLKYETPRQAWTPPYPETIKLFEAIFSNPERLRLPLDSLLILGY